VWFIGSFASPNYGALPHPDSYRDQVTFFVLIDFSCSFFARPKNEPKKGAGNANCSLFGRPLHKALLALPKRLQFAPFPGFPTRRLNDTLFKINHFIN
jgi:hypothetical protein